MKVHPLFYQNFIEAARKQYSAVLPRPIRSHSELTRIMAEGKLVKLKIPKLRLRKVYVKKR